MAIGFGTLHIKLGSIEWRLPWSVGRHSFGLLIYNYGGLVEYTMNAFTRGGLRGMWPEEVFLNVPVVRSRRNVHSRKAFHR